MLKLRASAILDAARLRMKVILRTVGEAVGWVFGFYIISWLNPSRSSEEIFWIMAFYIAFSFAYRFELLKAELDLR
jgi:Kef-type K+ transport system membrane component KefB